MMSKLAMQAYLGTVGASKVGFTVTGRDTKGQPQYVGGMLGATERNTMRYFLAIDAYLRSLEAPGEQRVQKRLGDWFAATERYSRQLHEMDRGEYLAMKEKETKRVGGGGACAGIEPLLMMRPPFGSCAFMMRIASWVQRKAPVRFAFTTVIHCSYVRSSMGIAGAPVPALLKSTSRRPNFCFAWAKR